MTTFGAWDVVCFNDVFAQVFYIFDGVNNYRTPIEDVCSFTSSLLFPYLHPLVPRIFSSNTFASPPIVRGCLDPFVKYRRR